MRMIDLFSGIGGFHLAAKWTWGEDLEVVAHCEINKFCQKILKKHWPNVPIISDIHNLKGNEFGTIDIVTGGFPCQPFSIAGNRRGTEDDRYLWPEMFRVIKEAKPRNVVIENVANIVSLALDEVLADLEGAGYETQAFILPACGVNAPHRRDRIWIVAFNDCETLANANTQGLQRSTQGRFRGIQSQAESSQGSKFSRRMPASGEYWTVEPKLGRVANGIPNRVDRIEGLGNAIVPQVAVEFFKCIKALEESI